MNILEALWYGNLTPYEKTIHHGSAYSKLARAACAEEERFRSELSAEGKAVYESFRMKQAELGSLSDCDIFIQGFQLGAQILLAALHDPEDSTFL